MKFLIFNIIVFCALGYLLTSKPNENFNQWVSNTKNKISKISKDEVISTIKKASKETKKINEINENKVNETSVEVKNKIKSQNKNNHDQIRKILNEILEEKKHAKSDSGDVSDEKLNEDFDRNIVDENDTKEHHEQIPKNNFMTLKERENALAELITDMELYHINNLAN